MKKKIIFILFFLCVCSFLYVVFFSKKEKETTTTSEISSYIDEQKQNKHISFLVRKNGKTLYSLHPDIVLPVGSVMKLLIAFEYCKQVSDGRLDRDSYVSVNDVDRYYVPGTDGRSHERWKRSLKELRDGENAVSLQEVVKGMMTYSSNANAEYLMERLGLDKINDNIHILSLKKHEPIYPIVSALYIPGYIEKEKQISKKELPYVLKKMSQEEYIQYANTIHRKFKSDGIAFQKNIPFLQGEEFEKIWSERLPGASARDYITLLETVNHTNQISPAMQKEWDNIMEDKKETRKYKKGLRYLGQKNGYTPWTVSKGFYTNDAQGNHMEFAFFSKGLTPEENKAIREKLRKFFLLFVNPEHDNQLFLR